MPWRRHKDAMNQLNVSLQHSIMTLAVHGWSHRRIARELDINRETVGKYLRLVLSKSAISTAGSPGHPAAEPAISTLGTTAGRQSLCRPWQTEIEAAVSAGLSAQRIYQDLVGEHGFKGSYQAVKRFVGSCARPSRCPLCGWKWSRDKKPRWILVKVPGSGWPANGSDRICFGSSCRIRARATVKWSGSRRPRASSAVWKMLSAILAEWFAR